MSNYNEKQPKNTTPKIELWKLLLPKGEASEKIKTDKDFIDNMADYTDYILTEGMENLVNERLAKSISKTQFRNLFDEVKKSEVKDLTTLQVKMMYTAGRVDNRNTKDFIRLAISVLKKDFDLGQKFMESALAYHKFYSNIK